MRGLFRVTQSYWLHVLMLALALHAYNRTAYLQGWVTSRPRFSDIAAPLYASTQGWLQLARELGRVPEAFHERLYWLVPAVITAVAWIVFVTWQLRARRALRPWALLPIAIVFVLAINLTTAMIDGGKSALSAPFLRYGLEYSGDVYLVRDDPSRFIESYPSLHRRLSLHARTHPPGAVLFLWLAGKVFDDSIETVSLVTIFVSSLTLVPAFLLAMDRAGPRVALITVALYAFVPSLVLFGATCMDGVFAVLPVTGVWLMNRALGGGWRSVDPSSTDPIPVMRQRWVPSARSALYALAAGVAFAAALFLTFAVAVLGVVYAALLVGQLILGMRAFVRTLLLMMLVVASIVIVHILLYWAAGYDPILCLKSAIAADDAAVGRLRNRPLDVAAANLVAFCIGAGIVSVVAWWHHVAHQAWLLAHREADAVWDVALFVGVTVAAFLGWFTLETERIWLFLIPLAVIAAAMSIRTREQPGRRTGMILIFMICLGAQTLLTEFVLNTWW
jgi:hypothetical protein